MLRAQAGNHYVFGLSRENITRLTDGQPIRIRLDQYGLSGPDVSISLCFGETEEAIALELQEFFSERTIVKDHRTR